MIGDILKILFSHMSYGVPGGFYIEGPAFLVLAGLGLVISLFAGSLAWVYGDAKRRNKNVVGAMLFILLTGWPGSFIWWFWLRPPLKEGK